MKYILHVMNMGKLLLLTSCIAALFFSCKEDDPISRRYPCRFTFYRQPHPTSIIFTACQSPGTYVYVYTTVEKEGDHSYRFVNALSNDGKTPTERNRIETQVETNIPYMLGASNEIGLIVGLTNFNGLTAFDRVCPNCSGLQPLAWAKSNKQRVNCSKCNRTYELETGNIVEGADGDALLRYGISIDDVRLNVGN